MSSFVKVVWAIVLSGAAGLAAAGCAAPSGDDSMDEANVSDAEQAMQAGAPGGADIGLQGGTSGPAIEGGGGGGLAKFGGGSNVWPGKFTKKALPPIQCPYYPPPQFTKKAPPPLGVYSPPLQIK